MWRPVGETFILEDKIFQVVSDGRIDPHCGGCYFHHNENLNCNNLEKTTGNCCSTRPDGQSVIFVLY